MVDKIEMSLDDIIKSTKKQTGPGRRPGRREPIKKFGRRDNTVSHRNGNNDGGVFRGRNRGIQKAKFSRGDVNSAWKHDLYDGPKRGGSILKAASLNNDSSKLMVSNLDYGVSDSDIQELFAEFGPLKKAAVHYDRSGRSLGTADVIFERRSDALKAIKQYNGVPLDGRPMKIELATDVGAITRGGRLGESPVGRRQNGGPMRRGGSMAGINQRRNGANPKNVANNSGKRGRGPAPTAEELDAELDAYVNDMKI